MAAEVTTIRRQRGVMARFGLYGLAAREAALGYVIVRLLYLFLLGFVFAPMLLAFYVSLTRWDALTPIEQARFVGFENYTGLFADSRFIQSIVHDFEWSVKAYVGQIGLGLLLAIIVTNIRHF